MRKVNAIFFATLILLINTGITVSTHYCGGMIVKKALTMGHETLGCAMNGMDDDCNNAKTGQTQYEDNCCDDEFSSLEIHDSFTYNSVTENSVYQFVFIYVVTIIQNFLSNQADYEAFTAYSPPDTNTDLTVLYRNFRI